MNRKFTLGIITLSVLLSACTSTSSSTTLEDKLRNPLFAKHYYEEMVDQMVTMQLNNDPMLKTSQDAIDRVRTRGTRLAQKAADLSASGPRGSIISDRKIAQGSALLLNDTLYFGADTYITPGPTLRVYLSNVLDPRQVRFPDETAIDLGSLQEPFGASQYAVPKRAADAPVLRTVVLWDTTLNMLYGFSQLSN